MTWLGKILAFMVLVGSIVMLAFGVNVYVARTNWKARGDAYEKAYKDSEANRVAEARDAYASREAAFRMYKAEKERADRLEDGYKNVTETGRKVDADYAKLEKDYREADVTAKKLQASVDRMQDELKNTRVRNNELEDRAQKLVIDKQNADRERVKFDNDAKRERAAAEEYSKKVEQLTQLVTELRQTGGSGTASVVRSIDRVPAALPENIRGTIMKDISGDLVQIDIGIDAGLEPGSKLDVYRLNGDAKYLGSLTITTTISPKQAVGVFTPARPVPISRLRPEELPKKGDFVGLLNGTVPR